MKLPTAKAAPFVISTYLALHLGFDLSARAFQVSPGVSLWYPPAGLALAFGTMYGLRFFPVVLFATLCSSFIGSTNPSVWSKLVLPVVISAIYIGAGTGARRLFGPMPKPTRPFPTSILITLYFAAPVLSAVAGSIIVGIPDFHSVAQFVSHVFNWWLGDFTGVLTITPLCLVHLAPRLLGVDIDTPQRAWRWKEILEIVTQGVTLLVCVWLLNGAAFIQTYHAHYVCFVPLVWICLRHGITGGTIATCTLTMGAIAAVRPLGDGHEFLPDVLLFVASIGAVGLGLGSAVTRRTRAESERSRLLAILEATTDFVSTCDLSGRVRYHNSALLKLRGHTDSTEVRGHAFTESQPAWAAEKVRKEGIPAALAEGIWHGETALLDLNGKEVTVSQVILAHYDDENRPVLLSTIARDITALKQAERDRLETERNLLQAQKLESLGVLAGGIAHDFNNLLTAVLGNATLARLDVPAHSSAEKAIHQIELAALRAAELCRQMLAYSGRGRLASAALDLSKLVEDTTHLLRVSISKKCSLEFALARGLPPVYGDSTQLSQIAMNLVMNAADAIGDRGGHIVVRSGLTRASRDDLAKTYLAPNLEPGAYVFLDVSDDGCGMTPEVMARIFEPFFTTKFTGHGLGLSAVLGIARSHQGAVKVESTPGLGTTFRLLLPAVPGAALTQDVDPKEEQPWRTDGRLLVVDDEDIVRDVSARVLERTGLKVTTVEDGQQAIDLLRRDPTAFRAVLLDLMMPVMDGEETFREIQRINPALPVVMMSGYSEGVSEERFAGQQIAAFVQKPFENSKLTAAIRRAVESDVCTSA